jgi:hypothetical protein
MLMIVVLRMLLVAVLAGTSIAILAVVLLGIVQCVLLVSVLAAAVHVLTRIALDVAMYVGVPATLLEPGPGALFRACACSDGAAVSAKPRARVLMRVAAHSASASAVHASCGAVSSRSGTLLEPLRRSHAGAGEKQGRAEEQLSCRHSHREPLLVLSAA